MAPETTRVLRASDTRRGAGCGKGVEKLTLADLPARENASDLQNLSRCLFPLCKNPAEECSRPVTRPRDRTF